MTKRSANAMDYSDSESETEPTKEPETKLGEGAFGAVVLLRRGGRPAAFKRFSTCNPRFSYSFRRDSYHNFVVEAFFGRCVRSDYLLPCFGVSPLGSFWMPYMELGTLEKFALLPSKPLPLARQLFKGVRALHARGFAHGDIKPSNVLLSGDPADPVLKLADFGLSQPIQHVSPDNSELSNIVATRWYRAPEQCRHVEGATHATVDMFSAALVLSELLLHAHFKDHPSLGFAPFAGRYSHLLRMAGYSELTWSPRAPPHRDAVPLHAVHALLLPIVLDRTLFPPEAPPLLAECAYDCLNYDPAERLTCGQALAKLGVEDDEAPPTEEEVLVLHAKFEALAELPLVKEKCGTFVPACRTQTEAQLRDILGVEFEVEEDSGFRSKKARA